MNTPLTIHLNRRLRCKIVWMRMRRRLQASALRPRFHV